jgi:GNAT superfamily N-acetyltransferase
MFHRRLEEVAMNAWPALQQMLFDGWVLRFAHGYTKRANSINPLFASSVAVGEKIVTCEQIYAARGLPAVFRLTAFAAPAELDQALAQRGYRRIDQTEVMHCDLLQQALPVAATTTLRHELLPDWLALWCGLHATSVEQHRTHAAMLDLIPSPRLLVSLVDAGHVVACGRGVCEPPFFGLFDLVTAPQHRNKGYGTQLVSGMLQWARDHGASHAYLQVGSTNTVAHHLYSKLGFQDIYRYWYRVPATG